MGRVESGRARSDRSHLGGEPARTARILLVEDDLRVARLMAGVLEAEGYEVTTVHTLRTAGLRLEGGPVDLIVLDIRLPDGSGLEFCQELRRTSSTPVIIVSAAGSPEERVAGFDAGADDYLAKPLYPAELAARVAALLRRTGLRTSEDEVSAVDGLELDARAGLARFGGREVALTRSEVGLLLALMQRAGTAVSTEELTEQVWNYQSFGESNFLHQHMSRMRRKLKSIGHPTEAIATVYGVGYVLRPAAEPGPADAMVQRSAG